MIRSGRVCRPFDANMHTGRMNQTSIERLRDYLAQLPPQSQALLMREFERALERGEDTTVASFVLEKLRGVARGTRKTRQRPRIDDPARLLFARWSRFSSTAIFRSAGSGPTLVAGAGLAVARARDGAPNQARECSKGR